MKQLTFTGLEYGVIAANGTGLEAMVAARVSGQAAVPPDAVVDLRKRGLSLERLEAVGLYATLVVILVCLFVCCVLCVCACVCVCVCVYVVCVCVCACVCVCV